MRLPTFSTAICCLLLAGPTGAQPTARKKEAPPAASKAEATPPLNTCGCYEDSSGICHCARKSRCGCPGECEPNGCEDKRRKDLEKESQEEVKRQQDDDKKRNAELAKKRDDEDRKDAQKREKNLRGLRLVEPARRRPRQDRIEGVKILGASVGSWWS